MPWIDEIFMILAGLIVLFFRRSKLHYQLWGLLVAYWMIGGWIQDVVQSNTIPDYNVLLAFISGLILLHIVNRSRTLWPIWILLAFILTILNDISMMIALDVGEVTSGENRKYQDVCYILFFLSLISLLHPVGRLHETKKHKFAYI